MSSPEQALFQGVIIRAIMDARGLTVGVGASSSRVERERARTWLCDGGEDFKRVCALAGFEPSSITAAFKAGKFDRVTFETTIAGKKGNPVGNPNGSKRRSAQ